MIFTDLIIPHLNPEQVFHNPAFALLFITLSHPHLHNEEFISKTTAILVTLIHLHMTFYDNDSCDCAAVTYIEMCVHSLTTDLVHYIDVAVVTRVIDSIPFSFTKLLFLGLWNWEKNSLVLPKSNTKFLSNEILQKFEHI